MSAKRLVVVALVVGVGWMAASSGRQAAEAEAQRQQELRRTDRAAWLAELKRTDKDRWWRELIMAAESNPDEFKPMLDEERANRARQSAIRDRSDQAKACVDKAAGYAAAQAAVERKLIAPSSAEWPSMDGVAFNLAGKTDPCRMKLTGIVLADNRFGVPLRLQWTVTLVQAADRRSWTVDQVSMVER